MILCIIVALPCHFRDQSNEPCYADRIAIASSGNHVPVDAGKYLHGYIQSSTSSKPSRRVYPQYPINTEVVGVSGLVSNSACVCLRLSVNTSIPCLVRASQSQI